MGQQFSSRHAEDEPPHQQGDHYKNNDIPSTTSPSSPSHHHPHNNNTNDSAANNNNNSNNSSKTRRHHLSHNHSSSGSDSQASSTSAAIEARQQQRVVSQALLRKGERPLTEDDIPSLPIVSHYTYAVLCEWVYGEAERRSLPPGWSVLLDATECYLDREGYYAAAFINDNLKSVVVAQRGTTNAEGLRAGVWVFFDEPTIQFHLAAQFSKLVRLRLQLRNPGCLPEDDVSVVNSGSASESGLAGGLMSFGIFHNHHHHQRESSDHQHGEKSTEQSHSLPTIYTISYTGHSLGSVIAACRAVEEHTFAVTFESPGCRKFVAQAMHPFKADDVDIITYLRNPNPVNSLKPHCGFLVQLPSEADDPKRITNMKKAAAPDFTASIGGNSGGSGGGVAGLSTARPTTSFASASSNNNNNNRQQQKQTSSSGNANTNSQNQNQQNSSASTSSTGMMMTTTTPTAPAQKRKRPFGMPNLGSLWSTQDFLRVRLLEAALPDVQAYLNKLEPALRELMDYTAQAHSISSIVGVMERGERTHQGQQVVLRWPENLLQFVEYYNIVRELNLIWDTTNFDQQQKLTHAFAAYKHLLSKLWQTEFRPHFRLPLGFLNVHSRTLLRLLGAEDVDYQVKKLPLSKLDRRVLATVYTESDNMVSTALSAFQMKQYLAMMTQRASLRAALERYTSSLIQTRSKL